jgi:hypothetical protein
VLHICHASGSGGVMYISRFWQWWCYIYISRFWQWWCYICITLLAVAVLHICHASGSGGKGVKYVVPLTHTLTHWTRDADHDDARGAERGRGDIYVTL